MIDADVRTRFDALVDSDDDSSWSDVVARAAELRGRRPLPRRRRVVAVAVVVACCAAAPAVALRGRITHLFAAAPPAPARVAESFADLDAGTPPDAGTGVVAGEARRALVVAGDPASSVVVWLAPTRRGGFCTILEVDWPSGIRRGGGGDCIVAARHLEVSTAIEPGPAGATGAGPALVYGYVGDNRATTLELEFEDGTTATLPFAWISKPVDSGLFVYALPDEHRRRGKLPTLVRVRDADGDELERASITGVVAGD
jgi:hypothetical protein